jgi:DNA-binding SARP family transcriptional activator
VYLPRVLRPLPWVIGSSGPSVQRIEEVPFTVVHGPPGSFVAESLAGLIEGWRRWPACVWLRLPRFSSGLLPDLLSQACLYRWGGIAQDGRVEAAAMDQLHHVLRQAPAGAVMVLEVRGGLTADLKHLVGGVRPILADRAVNLVAVVESHLINALHRDADYTVSTIDLADAKAMIEASGLPDRSCSRLLAVAGRRAAVVRDVLDAASVWAREPVVDALDASRRCGSMLDRLTANLLDLCTPGQRAALDVCAATGYWHPQLAIEPVQAADLRPWVVPLEQRWGWLRPIWAYSLKRHRGNRRDRRYFPLQRTTRDVEERPASTDAEPRAAARPTIDATLLGSFELRVDGISVATWSGQRGVSVLRFLLSRRRHTCQRDELLAEFWPEVAPDAARNRLQVAISGLRRSLFDVTNLNVIEYINGGYRVNPEFRVVTDVERFEAALATARHAERSGDQYGALVAYQEATEYYRGDFVSDAPYEQWTVLPRESLRMAYLDALDRLSRIQLSSGRLGDCIATGRRMLSVDPCREDAHQMLIRCFAQQGRIYEAIRQYDFCSRVLRTTLEVEPDRKTTELYRLVRAGSPLPDLVS